MHVIVLAMGERDEQQAGETTALVEATLVEAARRDPAAFGALYERYADRVYAYLRTRTRRDDDAADLTQQVFLRALDALPRYRGEGHAFAGWLFRIARNSAADAHRRQRATIGWDLVPEALQPRADGNLEAGMLRHEDLLRLRTLVDSLDAQTREILVLRFVAQLTIADIAAVVGKSAAATQSHLFRTIRALKEQYHDTTR